jgi:peptidoglycan/LPS O-acetylase OafA/YrhL
MAAEQDNPGGALARLPALDGLRGIAILLVLFLHFGVGAGFTSTRGPVGAALDRLFYVGWSGVDLFFVLSGFLITSILLATRKERGYFARFYGRRALRILPLHYVALVLALIVLQRVLLTYSRPLPPAAFLAIGLVGSFALASVSYHAIERPFLRLKRFVAYDHERGDVTAAVA